MFDLGGVEVMIVMGIDIGLLVGIGGVCVLRVVELVGNIVCFGVGVVMVFLEWLICIVIWEKWVLKVESLFD